MSLDQNLFTLNVVQRPDDRNIVDLVDTNGVAHYTKRRLPVTEYRIEVHDSLSEGLLASVTAPSATSKHKTLQLYNPDIIVELKFTGTLSFKWSFQWEDHSFEWKREECYILRKPDPAVLVALTKEPTGRLQTRTVQILDYNLNRFDIQDRKGLEIVILTALLTFSDQNETYHNIPEGSSSAAPTPPASDSIADRDHPVVPPKPAPRLGLDRVTELHVIRTAQGEGEANEVLVEDECNESDYAQYAARLLDDEAMLLVSIRSASAVQVPKVLRVVEETKWARHRSGVAEEEELHQYVIYESEKPKGPRRINLDPPKKDKTKEYVPPTSVIVHLSKIDMPELRPKVNPATRRRSSGATVGSSLPEPSTLISSDKERRKVDNGREKADKKSRKDKSEKSKKDKFVKSKEEEKFKGKGKESHAVYAPSSNRLTPGLRRHSSFNTPAHMTHSYQPSPSPSQLNNPVIYPPPLPSVPFRTRPVSMAFPEPTMYGGAAPLGTPLHTSGYIPPQQPAHPYQSQSSPSSGKGPVSTLLEMWSK